MFIKQNPLERPVPLSRTTLQLSTLPYFSNRLLTSRSLVYKLKPNTPKHLLTGGASRSPTWRFLLDIGDRERLRLRLPLLDLLPDRDRDRERDLDRDIYLLL